MTISPKHAAIAPGQKQQFKATASGGGQIVWLENGTVGGNTTLGAIDSTGDYTAPASIT